MGTVGENGGMRVYEISHVKMYYYEAAENSAGIRRTRELNFPYPGSKNSADRVFGRS